MSLIRKIGMISCDAKRTPTTRAILTLRGAAGRRDEGFLRKLENSPQERGILGWGTRPPRRVPFSSFVVPLAGGVGDSRESSKTSPDAIVESRVGRVPTSSPGDTIAITHRDETQRVASGDPPLRYPQCQCYATGHDALHRWCGCFPTGHPFCIWYLAEFKTGTSGAFDLQADHSRTLFGIWCFSIVCDLELVI